MKKSIPIFLFVMVFLSSIALAVDWTPQGNVNLRDVYNITGVVEIVSALIDITNLEADNLESNLDGTGYNITAAYFKGDGEFGDVSLSGDLFMDSGSEIILNIDETGDTGFYASGDDLIAQRAGLWIFQFIDGLFEIDEDTQFNDDVQFDGEINASDDITTIGDITADNFIGDMNWSELQNYPSACPEGHYLTQLNDSATCTSISSSTHNNLTINDTVINSSGIFTNNINIDDKLHATAQYLDNSSWTRDLLLYMPFQSGSQSRDFSGRKNHGTVVGATHNMTGGYNGFGVYEFDGSDDRISIPATDFNLTSDFTLMAWIKLDTTQGEYGGSVICKRDSLCQYCLRIKYDDISFLSSTDNSYTADLNNDTWYHVAVSVDSDSNSIYLDGDLKKSSSFIVQQYDPTTLGIGSKDGSSAGNLFNGSIDEVMVFNRSLSSEEIKNIYELRRIETGLLDNTEIQGNLTLTQKITFALGEIIDNIVDGWIRITGNLDMNNGIIANASEINGIRYVQAGNATDLNKTIEEAKNDGGGVVVVPVGTYTMSATINLTDDVIVQGMGMNTIIKPSGDFDVFLMCGDSTRIENLQINTQISGYNSSAVLFTEDCPEVSNWVYLDKIKINGNKNTSNTDKGISLIDDGSGGPGITWVLIKNVKIHGYRYGLYLETSDASAYVKGNTFENINFVETKYAIWENMTAGSSGGMRGNTFDVRMNGAVVSEYFAHIEGDDEYFYSVVFDTHLFNTNKSYNITSKADSTMIVDPILSEGSIINSGTNTNYKINNANRFENDVEIYQESLIFTSAGTSADTIVFKNNNGDKRMSFEYDNSNIGLELEDRYGDTIMYWDAGGGVTIGNGTSQENITLTSPNGTEFSCGVNNTGAFICS